MWAYVIEKPAILQLLEKPGMNFDCFFIFGQDHRELYKLCDVLITSVSIRQEKSTWGTEDPHIPNECAWITPVRVRVSLNA